MKIDVNEYKKKLKQRKQSHQGREHETLWCRVVYSLGKYNHIRDITTNGFAVYMVLQSYSNTERVAWPSMQTIAHNTGLSRTTVSKMIRLLEKKKWITVSQRKRKKDGTLENFQYKLIQSNLIRIKNEPSFLKVPPLPPIAQSNT